MPTKIRASSSAMRAASAFITDLRVTAHILEHLNRTSDVVPIAPVRAPPEDPVCQLDFDA